MAEITPKQLLEGLVVDRLASRPELRKEIGALIAFDIGGPEGGQWTLDATKESDFLAPGLDPKAKMLIRVSDAHFVAICTKKLNPQMAAVTGKLKFNPADVALAMRLGKLLS